LQVNGKIVSKIGVTRGIGKEKAEAIAFADDKMKAKLGDSPVRKVIVVPDKLVNIVI
jgi:leucyl-tRNA synthetase